MTTPSTHLSPVLRRLVKTVEAALGRVIAIREGQELYDIVEAVRLDMVAVREGHRKALFRARRRIAGLSLSQKAALARAYTVYLELVNACENAYRTHRLRTRAAAVAEDPAPHANAVFVLTAHPTESRSPANIGLLRRAQGLLIECLDRGDPADDPRLVHVLHLLWAAGTHPAHRPSVEDEARFLFSLLDDAILEELLRLSRSGDTVRMRTWVGGDKDGHPGVGPEETGRSLNLSRARLHEFITGRIVPEVEADIRLLPHPSLIRRWEHFGTTLTDLHSVTIGDGRRVADARRALQDVSAAYVDRRGHSHPRLDDLSSLFDQFPGLVVPVEMREARGLFQRDSVIADMLSCVRDVARGGQVDWYVCGCVVSMASRAEDLWAASALVGDVFKAPAVPIVPLFEMPDVLPRAVDILEDALTDTSYGEAVRSAGSQEVMLGYSDTSKRMGVLASRLAIHETMHAVNTWAATRALPVIFFHGSGGSVGRGGGTVADQAASWPTGALDVVKQTLQGEMVERTLATPEIFRSQVRQIAQVQARPPQVRVASAATGDLAHRSQRAYVDLVASSPFLDLLQRATPYARLGSLNIGSRPVRRTTGKGPADLEDLRAIPWVLCWTQTRYLLHAWAGIGTAWRQIRRDPTARRRLLRAVARDPLLRGYMRQLQFTLAKTEPSIWREYVKALVGESPSLVKRLERERQDALDLALQISPDRELLSHRAWLRESIYYRAPMIHPLNAIQIEMLSLPRLHATHELLLRETATGIAAGMLTTG